MNVFIITGRLTADPTLKQLTVLLQYVISL